MENGTSIVGTSDGRREDDFYVTPKDTTLALLDIQSLPYNVWEPACGNGAISKVLFDRGHREVIYRFVRSWIWCRWS